MRFLIQREIPLNEQGIDLVSQALNRVLEDSKCEHKQTVRLRLAIEEALLNWKDAGLAGQLVAVTLLKRFRKYVVQLKVKGLKHDPLHHFSDFTTDVHLQAALADVTSGLAYQYAEGTNILTGTITQHQFNRAFFIVLAMILGWISGFFCWQTVPNMVSLISLTLVTPVYSTLVGLVDAFIAPVVFLSLLIGIVNIGDPIRLRSMGKTVMEQIFSLLAVITLTVTAVCYVLLPMQAGGRTDTITWAVNLGSMFLNFVPTNLILTFSHGDVMQLTVLAVAAGMAIIYVRESKSFLVEIVVSLNKILQVILSIILNCMPVLIYFGFFKLALTKMDAILGMLGSIIAYNTVMQISIGMLMVGFLGKILHCRPLFILGKLMQPVLTSFATSSEAAASAEKEAVCKKKLGIQNNFCDFYLPLGEMLLKPGTLISIFVIILSFMVYYELPIDGITIMVLAISALVLSMTMQSVPGSALGSFTILFEYFNIPRDGLALCLAAVVLSGFQNAAFNTLSNEILAVITAGSLDMVDDKKLLDKE